MNRDWRGFANYFRLERRLGRAVGLPALFAEELDLGTRRREQWRASPATFFRMPGLLPFKLGAFVVAAETHVPVVPAALCGTRSILRADQWLPRRGRVELRVGEAIVPTGPHWHAALELRDAARARVLQLCGEPDLGDERFET